MLSGEWHIAKILEAQILPKTDKTKDKFKYYVTYLDENRRLDRHVGDSDIMLDPIKISEEMKSKEKLANLKKGGLIGGDEGNNLFENDEHLGMDKK